MDIKKEMLEWIENIATKTAQIETDLDVIVPDSKPDIKKILQIDANADATVCEVQNDRVLISGNVYFNVIYLPEDYMTMQSIKVNAPFTDVVTVTGVKPEMKSFLSADVLSVNYKIINGRKFSVKSVVEALFKVEKKVNIEPVSEISDKSIHTKNTDVGVMLRSGTCSKNIVINEKIIVPEVEPSIAEVLNVNAKVNEYSIKLINNKVIIKGDVKLVCVYANAVDGDVSVVSCVVPYTEIFDVEGVRTEDLCKSQIETRICEYNCEESSHGEVRGIEVKCVLRADISTFRDVKYSVIEDCYATDRELDVVVSNVKLPKRITDVNYNDTLKISINVADGEPAIERVYDAFSKAYIENVSVINDRLTINGIVDNYVMYVAKDSGTPIYCIKNEAEFSQQYDCSGYHAPSGEFAIEILSTSYTLNSDNSVDLRVNLKVNGVIYGFNEFNIITEVKKTENELPSEKSSIIVYFVQDSETLWNVAKRYFTTVDEIITINELAEEKIQKGMRLLIPKHKNN